MDVRHSAGETETRVWVAARDTPTSWYVVRKLAGRRRLAGVIWERPRTHRETLRYLAKRSRRLGALKVIDEVLLRAVTPLLHGRRNRQVAREILGPPARRRRPHLPDIPQLTVRTVNQRRARDLLRERGVDILLLCGTSIVKPPLLQIPSLATLNIHAGITPAYRGVHSPFWALLNGERDQVGVTLHRVDEGIDSGGILLQERLSEIRRRETPLSLWFRLLPIAVDLADRAIEQVARGKEDYRSSAETGLPTRLYTHPGLSDFIRLAWRSRRAPRPAARRERPVTICRIQSRICVGGPARHTILLSSRLDRRRFRTVLLGGTLEPGEQDVLETARRQQIEVHVLSRMHRRLDPLGDLLSLVQIVRVLRRERPMIVHTHTAKAGALGRLAARLVGIPIVIHTFHGHVFEGYFHPLISRFFVQIERLLARITDAIIVLSPAQERDICDRFAIAPRSKVHCISLGLDLERFAHAAAETGHLRTRLGIDERTMLIGTVGRLVPVKDHALFLETARKLCELPAERPLAFVLVGDGELRGSLTEQARRLGIDDRVHFLGWQHDLPHVFADLDLMVMTSLNEGTPVSVIEAMAAGVPVVSTRAGGVEDVLAAYPRGTIAASREPEELAGIIRRMLPAVLEQPRRPHGVERFGAERLVREIEELYEERLRAA